MVCVPFTQLSGTHGYRVRVIRGRAQGPAVPLRALAPPCAFCPHGRLHAQSCNVLSALERLALFRTQVLAVTDGEGEAVFERIYPQLKHSKRALKRL